MVIIEVEKEFDRFEDLLGLHKWSEILRNPTEEEARCSSSVFYCRFGSARDAQKEGWKQIPIIDAWFEEGGWSPNNRRVTVSHFPAAFHD
ncbi:hypothetical protein K488DRAFT_44530 [Vararia minispora EC-137]|uniref:Uncharacterized protein n=1 Tax=Vararia minispora EC-137 TaxID=1314806 RepID=A0ACB8QT26_9AGAM|nr:hypothetical protein K488DRAFT_44530 [Vararia minispora EC-137]